MNSEQTIAEIEQTVKRLLQLYNEALQRIDVLTDANLHQREELIRTHAELADLQAKHKQLTTAHALLADSPQRDVARKQITSIISKVDKALDLLKEWTISRT